TRTSFAGWPQSHLIHGIYPILPHPHRFHPFPHPPGSKFISLTGHHPSKLASPRQPGPLSSSSLTKPHSSKNDHISINFSSFSSSLSILFSQYILVLLLFFLSFFLFSFGCLSAILYP
ncbi:hypothetical protein HOY82DRAFT_515181, partial [Tuber indicum]